MPSYRAHEKWYDGPPLFWEITRTGSTIRMVEPERDAAPMYALGLDTEECAAELEALFIAAREAEGYVRVASDAPHIPASLQSPKTWPSHPLLHAALCADPADCAAPMQYADWLEQVGDDRSYLIAATVTHASGGVHLPLDTEQCAAWLGPLAPESVSWRHGFVVEARLKSTAELWLHEQLAALLALPAAKHLRALSLDEEGWPGTSLPQAFVDIASMNMPALTTLKLADVSTDPYDHFLELPPNLALALFNAPWIGQLEHLSVDWLTVGVNLIENLATRMNFRNLRTLDMHRCWTTPDAAEMMVHRADVLSRIDTLFIGSVGLPETLKEALRVALPNCQLVADAYIDDRASPPWTDGIDLADYFLESGGRREIGRVYDTLKKHGMTNMHVTPLGTGDWVLQMRARDFSRAALVVASNIANVDEIRRTHSYGPRKG